MQEEMIAMDDEVTPVIPVLSFNDIQPMSLKSEYVNSNKPQEERQESTSTTETSISVPVKTTTEKQVMTTNSGQVTWKVLDIRTNVIFYYALLL